MTTVMEDAFLERLVAWAGTRPDIQLVYLFGSQAREAYGPDAWADLDLTVITTAPEQYFQQTDWMVALGTAWVAHLNRDSDGYREWMLVYEGGLDADIAFLAPTEAATALTIDYRVLYDPLGYGAQLRAVPPTPAELPDVEQFHNTVQRFWRYAERTAKKLRRGELWLALYWGQAALRESLLQLVTWQAVVTHGPDYKTWYSGHYLERWADPQVVEALGGVYARYDLEDAWRALLALMDLFRTVSEDTAQRLGYSPPDEVAASISGWVRRLYDERG